MPVDISRRTARDTKKKVTYWQANGILQKQKLYTSTPEALYGAFSGECHWQSKHSCFDSVQLTQNEKFPANVSDQICLQLNDGRRCGLRLASAACVVVLKSTHPFGTQGMCGSRVTTGPRRTSGTRASRAEPGSALHPGTAPGTRRKTAARCRSGPV